MPNLNFGYDMNPENSINQCNYTAVFLNLKLEFQVISAQLYMRNYSSLSIFFIEMDFFYCQRKFMAVCY
jgi:hypothetical protein